MAKRLFDVELTEAVEADLESIYDYVCETRSPADAEALLNVFLDKIDALERFPLRGSFPRELDALGIRDYRQIILQPYRIIYRISESKVFILVIADGRRDMLALLERRLLAR